MHITGQCFCGAIAYEAEIDPTMVGICHCRDCQLFSGSAFRMTCAAPLDGFRFTHGEPVHFDKTADSGAVRRMAFCGTCGSHICARPTDETGYGYVTIRVSTCDQFAELEPRYELYCDSRMDWIRPVEGAQAFARMPE